MISICWVKTEFDTTQFHYTLTRMTKMKTTHDTKCWHWRHWNSLTARWECQLVQPLWNTISQYQPQLHIREDPCILSTTQGQKCRLWPGHSEVVCVGHQPRHRFQEGGGITSYAAAEVSKKGNLQESHIRINHRLLERKMALASESSNCFLQKENDYFIPVE